MSHPIMVSTVLMGTAIRLVGVECTFSNVIFFPPLALTGSNFTLRRSMSRRGVFIVKVNASHRSVNGLVLCGRNLWDAEVGCTAL